MKKSFILVIITGIIIIIISACKHDPVAGPVTPDPNDTNIVTNPCDPDTVYFQNTILPLLNSSCAKSGCHDATSHVEGVYLNNYSNIISTGEINPFNPDDSKLYEVITESDPDEIMPPPPNAPLTAAQIALVRKWILQGAKNNACASTDCDSVNVTFSGSIKPMLTNYCVGCHGINGPSAGISLVNYNDVVNNINTVWNSVNWVSGTSPMPKGGQKLNQCQIAKLRKWMLDGTPNN